MLSFQEINATVSKLVPELLAGTGLLLDRMHSSSGGGAVTHCESRDAYEFRIWAPTRGWPSLRVVDRIEIDPVSCVDQRALHAALAEGCKAARSAINAALCDLANRVAP